MVQTARSVGWEPVEASPPVLGAAAAQDEALGEKVFQRRIAGEIIGSGDRFNKKGGYALLLDKTYPHAIMKLQKGAAHGG